SVQPHGNVSSWRIPAIAASRAECLLCARSAIRAHGLDGPVLTQTGLNKGGPYREVLSTCSSRKCKAGPGKVRVLKIRDLRRWKLNILFRAVLVWIFSADVLRPGIARLHCWSKGHCC